MSEEKARKENGGDIERESTSEDARDDQPMSEDDQGQPEQSSEHQGKGSANSTAPAGPPPPPNGKFRVNDMPLLFLVMLTPHRRIWLGMHCVLRDHQRAHLGSEQQLRCFPRALSGHKHLPWRIKSGVRVCRLPVHFLRHAHLTGRNLHYSRLRHTHHIDARRGP